MNSKQLNIFKTLLFIFGLVIVGAAFAIVNYPLPEEGLKAGQKFFWGEIVICYLVFFVPFFFSSITSKTIDTKITSTLNIWISVIVFEAVAVTFAVLTLNEKVSVRTAFLVELIVLFLAAIFVYFGYFAGNHIGAVQAQEAKSLSKIAELKSAFEMLNLKTDMWGYELNDQKNAVKKLCDDVRYMSPVDTDPASRLEMKLIISANVLAESTLAPGEMNLKITELTNLINQRKLLKK
ncbi:hypothetical protein [uncultured Treponema sp.]|uniref:hypothetical protein n=1 Tax=uncultured Treponema sp. TaxID=162155 RepID=UPI0015C0FB01|nr:hypothetical protein [uncultured Treponema sp.]